MFDFGGGASVWCIPGSIPGTSASLSWKIMFSINPPRIYETCSTGADARKKAMKSVKLRVLKI